MLLVAVLLSALAAVVLAGCIAAAGARQSVAAADQTSAAATDRLRLALHDACEELRWSPWSATSAISEASPDSWTWSAEWRRQAGGPYDWATVTLNLTSRVSTARRDLVAAVELRPESFVGGVVVGGEIMLEAETLVAGSGVYGGASLRGREWLTFEPPAAGGIALDTVHPDVWPLAAVHTGGEIWAQGREIHSSGGGLATPWALDGDVHTESRDMEALTKGPDPLLVRAMEEHGGPTGLQGGVVDLGLLPAVRPLDAGGSAADAGYVVVLRGEQGRRIAIVGQRPQGACPVTLVVDGDAVVGLQGAVETVSSGALVVTGHLLVQGPLRHTGHVYAGVLEIAAPTRFETPIAWRSELPPGLAAPIVVAVSEGGA